jgi:predicted metal-dependent HD superfamily phosphohydrolase
VTANLHARWEGLCARLGAIGPSADVDLTFGMLESLYDHPPRAYHNLEHIEACLDTLDGVRRLADNAEAVELALWLHDSVYQPERADNEERSADAAGMIAGLLGVSPEMAARVRELVLVTRHDAPPAGGDEALVADTDLAILGAGADDYADYVGAIRREFGFASDEHFATGRHAFLERMLARERIYRTPYFYAELEANARTHLTRELHAIEDRFPELHHED